MESLHDHLDDVSIPLYGDSAIESSCSARLTRIQGRIVRKLRGAADMLYEHVGAATEPGETAKIGSQARAWLNRTADCIERIEPRRIKEDFTGQVRRNPGTSLLVAGAAGFILSSIFRRR